MLSISQYQLDKMAEQRLKEFILKAVHRLETSYPAELQEAGYWGEVLEAQVSSWIEQARSYGLRSRSQMDDFVDACVLAKGEPLLYLHPQLRCLENPAVSVEEKMDILQQTLVFGFQGA